MFKEMRQFLSKLLLISMLMNIFITVNFNQVFAGASYDSNLVIDGDGESFDGWSGDTSNDDFTIYDPASNTNPSSGDGGNVFDYFPTTTPSNVSIYQIIDIDNLSDDISIGVVKYQVSGYMRRHSDKSTATITVEELDESSNPLTNESKTLTCDLPNGSSDWQHKNGEKVLNENAKKLRVTLTAEIFDPTLLTDFIDFDGVELILKRIPVIDTSAPANGTVGLAYAGHTFTSIGGTGTKSYALKSGSLPSGLSLDPNGALTGTPTSDGTSTFTVEVTDSNSQTDSHEYTIVIDPAPLAIDTSAPANGTVGLVYAGHTFTSTGGTGTKSYALKSGSLPSNLILDPNGALTGTPTSDGTSTFTIEVTDSNSQTDSHAYTIVIDPASLAIDTSAPANGTVGLVYAGHTFTSTGGVGTKSYALKSGSLPSNLTLDPNGTLTGTPTSDGTSTFTIEVTDSNSQTDSHTYTIVIDPADLIINTNNPTDYIVGTAYAGHTFTSVGGTDPKKYTLTSGSLPFDMNLSNNGDLTGTTTQAGTYVFAVTVEDSGSPMKSSSHTFELNVVLNVQPLIMNTSNPTNGMVGHVYSGHVFDSTGGTGSKTYELESGQLPDGLNLSSNGNLSGTPTLSGMFVFAVKVTDSASPPMTDSYTFLMDIQSSDLCINTLNPSNGTVGSTYLGYTFGSTGGAGTKVYKVISGNLPSGLSLSTEGHLSGTPTTIGTSSFTIEVTDSASIKDSHEFTMEIDPLTLSINTSNPSDGTVGNTYSGHTFDSTGGTGAKVYKVISGNLPSGLSLSTEGILSGTPTSSGTFTFAVEVKDSASSPVTDSHIFTLTIDSAPSSGDTNNKPSKDKKDHDDKGNEKKTSTNPTNISSESPETAIMIHVEGVESDSILTDVVVEEVDLPGGRLMDEVHLDSSLTSEIIKTSIAKNEHIVKLPLSDVDNNEKVDLTQVEVPHDSMMMFNESHIGLQISSSNATLSLSDEAVEVTSNNLDEDLYFRLRPVKNEDEMASIVTGLETDEALRVGINNAEYDIIGKSMVIETNMPSAPVDVVLPLTEMEVPIDQQSQEALNETLFVHIDHGNDDKEVVKGKLVKFDEVTWGLNFSVNHFSTFTIVCERCDSTVHSEPSVQPLNNSGILIATEYNYSDLLAGSVWLNLSSDCVYRVKNSERVFNQLISELKINAGCDVPIYILGENLAISHDLDKMLNESGYKNVVRIGGVDQYETAEKIINYFAPDKKSDVMLVDSTLIKQYTNTSINDLAKQRIPILYMNDNKLPNITRRALNNINPDNIYFVNEPSQQLIDQLIQLLGKEVNFLTLTEM